MQTLDDDKVIDKLNKDVSGKTIDRISYNEYGMDCLVIYFTDGSKVVLSTLGGIEIEQP